MMAAMIEETDNPKGKTLTERIYRLLREDIISGELPAGTKLKIELLGKRYECSSGPLREALSRLSGEFLVKLVGQRGFIVPPISVKDAREIGDLRMQMEAHALVKSIRAGDDNWEERVITTHHRLERLEIRGEKNLENLAQWENRNRAFHEALVSACPSDWLLQVRNMNYLHHERYRRISRIKTVLTRDIHQEHLSLRDFALDRNTEGAVETIRNHIQHTTNAVAAALEHNQTDN